MLWTRYRCTAKDFLMLTSMSILSKEIYRYKPVVSIVKKYQFWLTIWTQWNFRDRLCCIHFVQNSEIACVASTLYKLTLCKVQMERGIYFYYGHDMAMRQKFFLFWHLCQWYKRNLPLQVSCINSKEIPLPIHTLYKIKTWEIAFIASTLYKIQRSPMLHPLCTSSFYAKWKSREVIFAMDTISLYSKRFFNIDIYVNIIKRNLPL